MPRPLIALTADYKHMEPYWWHAAPYAYVDAAIDVADVIPMILPSVGERMPLEDALDHVDGVLVTGSRSNVHPSNYGEAPTQDHEPFDPDRDASTLPLIRRAIERGIPLLAICRGIQELNVAMGGTITASFQKNRNIEGHSYPTEGELDERFGMAHTLDIAEGSCIAEILQEDIKKGPVSVNSLHTQALEKLGRNVVVEALAEDGTIEAISIADAPGFAVGVQWHPEYWAVSDSPSRAILNAFGDATRKYRSIKNQNLLAAE